MQTPGNNSTDASDRSPVPSYIEGWEGATGNGEIDFWCPLPSGDDATDIARGIQLANEALFCAKHYGSGNAIALPLLEMARRGKLGTLEEAFIYRIGEAARCGSMG